MIRNADGKRLRLIAREIRDLADRAPQRSSWSPTSRRRHVHDHEHGPVRHRTLTLPIINQPQVAILGDRRHQASEPVVVEGPDGDDAIAIHHVGHARRSRGTTARSTARTPPRSSTRCATVLETRDWEAELA